MQEKTPFHIRIRKERERRYLSQQELAEEIKVNERTIRRWENGESVPSPFYQRQLIAILGVVNEINEENDVQTHQEDTSKVPINQEQKRSLFLPSMPPSSEPQDKENGDDRLGVRQELSEVPYIINFQGRAAEVENLRQWIITKHCQIVAILGAGGVGKTALAAHLLEDIKPGFVKIFWRSLHNAPPFEHILNHCIQFVSSQEYTNLPNDIGSRMTILVQHLQRQRCLIVLDNVESIMQAGSHVGQYREGYESYGQFFQRLGEVKHQSCLVLTSREKPSEIDLLEGKNSAVHSFYLNGLGHLEGKTILCEKELFGQDEDWVALVNLYAGNPLALKLVSGPIEEVFGGDIARFLHESEAVFGNISDLLNKQFQRLSTLEQEILCWLAIEREAVTIDDLYQALAHPLSKKELFWAFASLRRRSLVEKRSATTFSLQAVIIEYVTNVLVSRLVSSFQDMTDDMWHNYALLKAQTKDYLKASQVLLIMTPIVRRLLNSMREESIEEVLLRKLEHHRQSDMCPQSYLAGNVLNLLIYLQRNLRGKDFSSLTIRQADLQNVHLPEVNFARANFSDVSFTNTFGNVLSVTFSPQGNLLATGTASGEIWIYDALSRTPLITYRGHTDAVWSVVFNQDSTLLASCSDDGSIRLWESNTGRNLKTFHNQKGRVRSLAFNFNGSVLASGSENNLIQLWDVQSATCLKILEGHTDRVWSVAFSPDGKLLGSGSTDRSVRLWDVQSGQLLTTLQGHSEWVRAIAFSPAGDSIASAGDDKCINLWDVRTGEHLQRLQGHSGRIWTIAFDANGQRLVSGSEDQSLRVWDLASRQCSVSMQGHSNGVRSVSFSPDGQTIMSGGDDQTTRFWDAATGYCLRTLYGHTNRIWSAIFSPDGGTLVSCYEDRTIRLWDLSTNTCCRTLQRHTHGVRAIAPGPDGQILASGGEDQLVRLWDMNSGRCFKTLEGHTGWIRTVAFSRDGRLLASAGEDLTIRLWEASSGKCLFILNSHTSWIRSLAFHPDSTILASASDSEIIRLWDTGTGNCTHVLKGHTGRVRSVCFHPTRPLLASGSEDGTLRLWDIVTGACLTTFLHHQNWVRCVTFSPDGAFLASSSDDQDICLWDVDSGLHRQSLRGHKERVRWVSFHPDGQRIASSSDDGTIKIWDIQTGRCLHTLFNERPYERMNITSVQGLTDAQKMSLQILGAIEEDTQENTSLSGQGFRA